MENSIDDDEDLRDYSLRARYGSKEAISLANIPMGFAEINRKSLDIQKSKDETLDQSTSNFSDHFKSYKERINSVYTIPSQGRSNDRVSESKCRNCYLL